MQEQVAAFTGSTAVAVRCAPPSAVLGGGDGAAAQVVALVSRQRDVSPPLLLHRSRGRASIAEARQLAMYLTHVVLRRTYAEVGSLFGRDRTTVAHACARIEDLRDSPAFDAELQLLEAAIAVPERGRMGRADGSF